MTEHKRFTVEQGCSNTTMSDWFVRFTPETIKYDDGSMKMGLSFPAIAATNWVNNPEKTLNGLADMLNEDDRKDALIADLVRALKPFLPAYNNFVSAMNGFKSTGETLSDSFASEQEREATAKEEALLALSDVTFDQLNAVNTAIAKAEGKS